MAQQVRRVVTGLDANGRSRVTIDGLSPHVMARDASGVTEIWTSGESPASYDFEGDRAVFPIKHDPVNGGSLCRVIEMAPGAAIPDGTPLEALLEVSRAMFTGLQSDFEPTLETVARHPSFHKTNSLDYLVILSGQLTMLMDEGEVTLDAGDVIVQQGVLHGWRVEGDEPVRMFAVLIDGVVAQAEVKS